MPHEERFERDLKRSYQRDLKRSYQRDLYTLDLRELAVKFIHIEICETCHKRPIYPQKRPICHTKRGLKETLKEATKETLKEPTKETYTRWICVSLP